MEQDSCDGKREPVFLDVFFQSVRAFRLFRIRDFRADSLQCAADGIRERPSRDGRRCLIGSGAGRGPSPLAEWEILRIFPVVVHGRHAFPGRMADSSEPSGSRSRQSHSDGLGGDNTSRENLRADDFRVGRFQGLSKITYGSNYRIALEGPQPPRSHLPCRRVGLESVALMREKDQVSVLDGLMRYFSDFARHSVRGRLLYDCVSVFLGFGEARKEVTEQYPDPISSKTEDDLPPRTRGLLENDIDACTGCRECERVCPTECFTIETQPGADSNKLWVATFDIDLSRCVFCGLCTEVCLPQSLIHTKEYEGAARSATGMIRRFGRGDVTPEQQDKWAAIRKQQEESTL